MQPGNSYIRGIFTYSYPHTVENGARERITFVQRVEDPASDRLEFENHLKLGSGPRSITRGLGSPLGPFSNSRYLSHTLMPSSDRLAPCPRRACILCASRPRR